MTSKNNYTLINSGCVHKKNLKYVSIPGNTWQPRNHDTEMKEAPGEWNIDWYFADRRGATAKILPCEEAFNSQVCNTGV